MTFPKLLISTKWLLLLASFTLASGCSHKQAKPDREEFPVTTSEDSREVGKGDIVSSDTGNAYGLQSIHFGYDSNSLDSAAKALLRANADTLKKNPTIRVQIEGHCDSRGGIQYNIALGEKRTIVVKEFLEGLGLQADRIATVSYGKEHPLDSAETEAAYAKNRRANFVITKGLM